MRKKNTGELFAGNAGGLNVFPTPRPGVDQKIFAARENGGACLARFLDGNGDPVPQKNTLIPSSFSRGAARGPKFFSSALANMASWTTGMRLATLNMTAKQTMQKRATPKILPSKVKTAPFDCDGALSTPVARPATAARSRRLASVPGKTVIFC